MGPARISYVPVDEAVFQIDGNGARSLRPAAVT
jgi:hypothetical protein